MLVVCEPQCKGFAHECHNAGMLLALSRACPEEKILFLAEEKHISSVKYCFDANKKNYENIIFEQKDFKDRNDSFSDIIYVYPFIESVFKKAIECGANKILFLSSHTNSLISAKLLRKKYPGLKIFMILHAIMEYAANKFFWSLFKRNYVKTLHYFRYALAYGSNNDFTYIVLSPFCKNTISNEKIFSHINIEPIYHPTIFDINNEIFSFDTICFATIGAACNPKKIVELDNLLMQSGLDNYKIYSLGEFPKELHHSSHICIPNVSRRLTRKELSDALQHIDILLYFYDYNRYCYSQSGSFYEIFQYHKPAIFLHNKNFDWHNSELGGVGKSVSSIEEMKNEIKNILSFDSQTICRYKRYKENIAVANNKLTSFNKIKLMEIFCNK